MKRLINFLLIFFIFLDRDKNIILQCVLRIVLRYNNNNKNKTNYSERKRDIHTIVER